MNLSDFAPAAPAGARRGKPVATRIDVTIECLYQLRERIERQQLEGDDWVVVGALVSSFIARTEARQARLKAKAAQQAAPEKGKQSKVGPGNDVGHSPDAEDTAAGGESSQSALPSEPAFEGHEAEGAAGHSEPAGADSTQQGRPNKGHGRHGADAFTNASTHRYALAAGVIGGICALCGVGRIFGTVTRSSSASSGSRSSLPSTTISTRAAAGSAGPSSPRRGASSSHTEALAPATSSAAGRPAPRMIVMHYCV
ncbi:hypothetical protein ACFL5O_10665, partial [Myxococcota bacterium]